jgi:integrase
MASIGSDDNGFKRILFVAPDDKRKTIRLGNATMKQANAFKVKVEALVAQTITGVVDDEVSRWLAGLDTVMYGRLVAVGLAAPRTLVAAAQTLLGDFLDNYIAGRTDAKSRTILNLKMFRDRLTAFFGRDRDLTSIKHSDADAWLIHLKANYAASTVGRTIKGARQFFRAACRANIIDRNPFEDLKAGSNPDKDRQRFITLADTQLVLDACPDAEWRLLVALSRFGGLRCPSEHLSLTWADVDWEHDRFWVRSPKTEHHEGKEGRWVPLFPELRPYLEDARELAAEGAVYVINRYHSANHLPRSAQIVRTAQANLMLCSQQLPGHVDGSVIDTRSISPRPHTVTKLKNNDRGLFYIAFTSGSTGAPKGALIGHDNFSSFYSWYGPLLQSCHGTGAHVNHASFSFDMGMLDLWPSLALGKPVILLNHRHNALPRTIDFLMPANASLLLLTRGNCCAAHSNRTGAEKIKSLLAR